MYGSLFKNDYNVRQCGSRGFITDNEKLAQQICVVMKKYPLNKYILFIQHSELDKKLNSYDVFRRLLSDYVLTFKSEESSFTYMLNYKELTLDFCYDILINR